MGVGLDARAKWELAGWSALLAGVFAGIGFALSSAAPLWIAELATGSTALFGVVLGPLSARYRWKAEGGLEASREVDGWIRDRRLPTDRPLGEVLARLEKRKERLLIAVPAAFMVINGLQAPMDLSVKPVGPFPLPALHLVATVLFGAQLAFSLIRRPRVAALIREGQRRFASGEAADASGAPPSGASSSAPSP
jgi:hypothetical protein